MKADEARLSDLMLEQYALGELSGLEKARVDVFLASNPKSRERLAELLRSNEEILAQAPPAEIAAAIRRRMLVGGASPGEGASARGAAGARRRRFVPASAFAFPAAAAVLVFVGVFMAKGLLFPAQGDGIRVKSGAPGLLVFKKAAAGPLELADGAAAAAGDVLQIKYAAGSARYGAIVSLDGRGAVTWHLPGVYAKGPASNGLAPRIDEKGAALDSAYELDDAPAFERFFILSSKDDFDLSLVASALHDLALSGRAETGAPRLPSALEYKSFLLRKAAR
jgi:hypothetical protein